MASKTKLKNTVLLNIAPGEAAQMETNKNKYKEEVGISNVLKAELYKTQPLQHIYNTTKKTNSKNTKEKRKKPLTSIEDKH